MRWSRALSTTATRSCWIRCSGINRSVGISRSVGIQRSTVIDRSDGIVRSARIQSILPAGNARFFIAELSFFSSSRLENGAFAARCGGHVLLPLPRRGRVGVLGRSRAGEGEGERGCGQGGRILPCRWSLSGNVAAPHTAAPPVARLTRGVSSFRIN